MPHQPARPELTLPDDVAAALLEHGPAVADACFLLHRDPACTRVTGRSRDRAQTLAAVLADLEDTPAHVCNACGPDLNAWLEVVGHLAVNFGKSTDSPLLAGLVDAYTLPFEGEEPAQVAPACCAPGLADQLADPPAWVAEVERVAASAMHRHRLAGDVFAGHERTHALLISAGLHAPGPTLRRRAEVEFALRALRTQHIWARTTLMHDFPFVAVYQLPTAAAAEFASSLSGVALPSGDLTPEAWRVLRASVAATYATERDPQAHARLAADLPVLLDVARAAAA